MKKSHKGSIKPRESTVSYPVSNLPAQIINTSVDRIDNALRRLESHKSHLVQLGVAGSVFLTSLGTILTSNFKNFMGIPAQYWWAFFFLLLLASAGATVYFVIRFLCSKRDSRESILAEIKKQAKQRG